MIKRYLSIAGLLGFAFSGFAQDTMKLTGLGEAYVCGGVYCPPYDLSVNSKPSQLMICDDYTTEISVGDMWYVDAESAADAGTEGKFQGQTFTESWLDGGVTQNTQAVYDAAAYLAVQLMANYTNQGLDASYSAAIWYLFDPNDPNLKSVGTSTAEQNYIITAFNAGAVDANRVTVYTPVYKGGGVIPPGRTFPPGAQEMFAVPEPSSPAILGLDLLSVLCGVFLLRRYRVRA